MAHTSSHRPRPARPARPVRRWEKSKGCRILMMTTWSHRSHWPGGHLPARVQGHPPDGGDACTGGGSQTLRFTVGGPGRGPRGVGPRFYSTVCVYTVDSERSAPAGWGSEKPAQAVSFQANQEAKKEKEREREGEWKGERKKSECKQIREASRERKTRWPGLSACTVHTVPTVSTHLSAYPPTHLPTYLPTTYLPYGTEKKKRCTHTSYWRSVQGMGWV